MQTSFTQAFLQSHDGQRVNEILRNCVHCGFCNATCPTFQLTGDELDGPRGRIYLIKNFFENKDTSKVSQQHLDRCLTCLACETTCPSGVEYGDLVDIGRKHFEKTIERPFLDNLKRNLIIRIFSHPRRVVSFFALARLVKPILPRSFASKIPVKAKPIKSTNTKTSKRKMLTIKGCVQSTAAPQINAATSEVLQNSDIQLDEAKANCCGALAYHLTNIDQANKTIRGNIDNWYEKLSSNHEYLLVTSSGCSSFIKQYSTIMQADKSYADKAKFVSQRCRDLTEMTPELKLTKPEAKNKTVAFHSPCTLQHGQKILGNVENKLREAGYQLIDVKEPHLCCGSAGSYSLLEEELSNMLLQNKISTLEEKQPDVIATANIGCLLHLQSGTQIPVKHWIELLS